MIKRIVKLTFHLDKIEAFKTIFETSKEKIRARQGCHHLELWQGVKDKNVFFTYSIWTSEDDLNAYRDSELFKETWAKTKVLFSDKPYAWSVDMISQAD